jgi:hypothetical protein
MDKFLDGRLDRYNASDSELYRPSMWGIQASGLAARPRAQGEYADETPRSEILERPGLIGLAFPFPLPSPVAATGKS